MTTAHLIVLDDSEQWLAPLRWALTDANIRVLQAESLDDCLDLLARMPTSLVGLALREDNLDATFRSLPLLRETFPSCGIMVLASRGMELAEALSREAGAIHYVCSIRDLTSTARVVERFVRNTDEPAATYRDQVRQRMPWRDRLQQQD